MNIDSLQLDDIPQLYDFYSLIHPENSRTEIKSYTDHWLTKAPDSANHVLISDGRNS